MDSLFARPGGPAVRLTRQPVPESGDDDQPHPAGLTAFLNQLERDLSWGSRTGGHLSLDLTLGLPGGAPLDGGGYDLDGYLFPVVRRLGPVRFDAVFAGKEHAAQSFLRIGPATRRGVPLEPARVQARVTPSATSIAWKEELHAACRRVTAEPAPPGPVDVEIRLTVSRRRNWSALWKPAVDSLGPILGVTDPTRPYRASDDRIATLALHRRLDDLIGDRVGVEIWWQPGRTATSAEPDRDPHAFRATDFGGSERA